MRRESGTAFLLITHDLSLVQYFCQRVVVLAEGHVVEDQAVSAQMGFAHPAACTLQAAVLPAMPVGRERKRVVSEEVQEVQLGA